MINYRTGFHSTDVKEAHLKQSFISHASLDSEKTMRRSDIEEAMLDEALELTFPASDPIAVSLSWSHW